MNIISVESSGKVHSSVRVDVVLVSIPAMLRAIALEFGIQFFFRFPGQAAVSQNSNQMDLVGSQVWWATCCVTVGLIARQQPHFMNFVELIQSKLRRHVQSACQMTGSFFNEGTESHVCISMVTSCSPGSFSPYLPLVWSAFVAVSFLYVPTCRYYYQQTASRVPQIALSKCISTNSAWVLLDAVSIYTRLRAGFLPSTRFPEYPIWLDPTLSECISTNSNVSYTSDSHRSALLSHCMLLWLATVVVQLWFLSWQLNSTNVGPLDQRWLNRNGCRQPVCLERCLQTTFA